jgi:hypothetical protein
LALFSSLAVVFPFSGFILNIPTLVVAMMVEDLIVLQRCALHRSPEFSLCNSELHPCGAASAAVARLRA